MSDQSGLEKMQKRLYSRAFKESGSRKRKLSKHEGKSIASRWSGNTTADSSVAKSRHTSPFLVWSLVLSVLFFIVSAGIATLFLLGGRNTVSTENVEISFFGPVIVPAGEDTSLQITITNHNPVVLNMADLLIEFPPGSRSVTDRSSLISRHREEIGDLKPGETVQRLVQFIPFGEIDSTQELSATLEYKVDNSSALFFKVSPYSFGIGASPIRLVVDTVKEINAGQEIEVKLTLTSNANQVLNDVVVKAEYPFGFAYIDGAPEPSDDRNIWELGDIAPDGSKRVTIRGIVEGQEEEERVFRFTVGLAEGGNSSKLTPVVSVLQSLVVRRPFLALDLVVNNNIGPEHSVDSGGFVKVAITWENTLPSPLIDAGIEAKITGDYWDRSSVKVPKGFFRSADDTVIWNQQTNPDLATLESGSSGKAEFNFFVPRRDDPDLAGARSPEISVEISARGRRVSEVGVPEDLRAVASAKIKINTDTLLTGRVLHHTGPFTNSGPIPPRVDQETTYTIVWSFTNTTNELKDVEVSTSLPTNVRFVGPVDPSGEDVIFHPVGGQVVWSVGRLSAGLGSSRSPREAAFQVAITPSLTQLDSSPLLLNVSSFTAEDVFTGQEIEGQIPTLSTRFSEPQYNERDERVVK